MLLLVSGLAGQARAGERDYYFERIDSARGLAQNTIGLIYQDRSGYMWLATQGGLHRYDGYDLRHYRHDPSRPDSLPDNMVTAMTDAGRGRLWVATISGQLSLFDPDSDRTLPLPAAWRRQLTGVTALAGGEGTPLVVGAAGGIFAARSASGRLTPLWTPVSAGDAVRSFTDCRDGGRYALTGRSVVAVGHDAAGSRVLAAVQPGTTSLVCLTDGRLLMGGTFGVVALDRHDGSASPLWPTRHDATTPATDVRAIAQDHAGRLWLAVRGTGLVRVDGQGRTLRVLTPHRDIPGTLAGTQISTLYVDRSGLLWTGSLTHGASYTNPDGSPFHYFVELDEDSDPDIGNNVRALHIAGDGRVWIGLSSAGLRSYDPASRHFTDYGDAFASVLSPGEIRNLGVYAITDDGDGLRLATNRGLFHFDPVQRRVEALYRPDTTHDGGSLVRTLVHARDGSWWFSVDSGGVLQMRDGAVVRRFRAVAGNPRSLASDLVLSLVQDDAGNIWAGTVNGLSRIAPDGAVRTFNETPPRGDALSGDVVTSLFTDKDGALWVGTQTGLDRLLRIDAAGAHFHRYLVKDGLPDATIYCIRRDARHHLWVSTNLGIARLDVASGRIRAFGLRDGLQGLEYNAGACTQGGDGSLLFGGVSGYDQVQPASIRHDPYSPPVVITDVRIGVGARAARPPVDAPLEMDHSDRVVHFDFAAMDFAAPDQNRFRYRLVGFDHDWIDAGTRHMATYTNLDSGTYRFEVQGSNHQGVFGTHTATMTMRVMPAWWQSSWARALYVMLAALAALTTVLVIRTRRADARRYQRQLRVREDRLSMALWGSGDAFWDLDLRTNRLYRPDAELVPGTGSSREMNLDDWRNHIVHPDDLDLVQQALDDHLAGKSDYIEQEFRVRDRDQGWVWLLARGKVAERDETGNPLRICGTARDVSQRRHAESDLRIASEVIRSMTEAVTVTDLEFHFRSVNPAFTRMTGYGDEEIVGTDAAILNSREHDPGIYGHLREQVGRLGHWRGELWQRRKDGSEFLSWVEISAVHDSGGMRTHYVAVLTDITDRKRTEQELRYLANYDMLTGLPNRTLLSERLADAIAAARRNQRQLAVLYVDLDRFKHINDSMGHATGDQLLKSAGARLRQCVRDHDTVARVGGDEFTLVIEDVDGEADAEAAADRIIHAFATPLLLESRQEVLISPSVGIALHPRHGRTADDLLKYADTAMYHAKERGRNVWALYTEDMDASARLRASMSGALRRALERDELDVVYQPKQALAGGRIVGVEALMRWHSAELGEVPPAIFVPLAEESGLIVEMGEFVLRRACADLANWRRDGLDALTMAVNLSMAQLQRSELPRTLRTVLDEYGIPAHCLELELTESMVMGNVEQSVHTLGELKAIGATLAIDDFGTGYSSLAYLKRLPIDTLKVDRAFVGDVTVDPEDATITTTIINMAHSLGMSVVAEGVETEAQLAFLRAHGCDVIQGNWLSPPLSATDCQRFCTSRLAPGQTA